MSTRRSIHTTIDRNILNYIKSEADKNHLNMCDIIERAVRYYRDIRKFDPPV